MRLISLARAVLVTAAIVATNAGPAAAAPPKKPPPRAAPAAKPAPAAPPKPAPAAAPPAPAPSAYDEGVALFRAGNSEGALAIFKKLTTPEARRGAAFALEKLGRNEEAIAEWEAFIATAPPSAEDQVRAGRVRVSELAATRKGKVHVVTVPPGATIEVAGRSAPAGTSPVDVDLPPGRHVLRATLAGNEPAEREVDVAPGSTTQEVRLELAPAKNTASLLPVPGDLAALPPSTSPARPPAPPSAAERYGAPIVTGLVGSACLAASAVFGLSAMKKNSDYEDAPTEQGLADAETDAALSTAALVGGLVLVTATVVLLVTKPSPSAPGPKPAAARIRPDGLRFHF